MFNVTVDISGALLPLKRLMAMEDFSGPLELCGNALAGSVRRRFMEGGGSEFPWATNEPLTLLQRKSRNQTGSVLRREDEALLKSFTRGAADNYWRIGRNRLDFGSRRVYAGLMQHGGNLRPRRFPFMYVIFGANVTAAERAQFGLQKFKNPTDEAAFYKKIKRAVVPPRPFLYAGEQDLEEFQRIFAAYVQSVIRG